MIMTLLKISKPIRNVIDTTIVEAFDEISTQMENKGYNPIFNVTYNQPTGALNDYMKREYCI